MLRAMATAKPKRAPLTEAHSRELTLAAQDGDGATVQRLLAAGAPDAKSDALFYAAQNGHTDCVRALLAAGLKPNARTSVTGGTPVEAACIHDHTDAVALLLERLPKLDAKDPSGWTLLHVCAWNGSPRVAALLL